MTRRFTPGTGRPLVPALLVTLTLLGVAAPPAPAGDKAASAAGVFDPPKVWPVHISLSAEEYAAIQPRGGFGGFSRPGQPPKEPEKPAEPKRDFHRSQFGAE